VGCPPSAAYPAPLPPPAGGAPTTCALSLLQNGNIHTSGFNSDSPPSWSVYDFAEAAWNNSWKLPAGVITSITSYFEHTANNRTQLIPLSFPTFTTDGYDPLPSNVLEHYHQFTQEVRFQSNLGSRFDYMFGAYYSHDTLVNTSGTGFYFAPFGAILSGPPFDVAGVGPTDAITGIPRLGETDHTISGFASATIHATDQLRLNLGGRYSQITKDGSHSLTFGTSVNNTDGTFVPWPNASLQLAQCVILTCDNNQFSPSHLVESKFMPSAGLQYDIVPNLMSYLTYTNGFKAGGFSGAATSNTFGPESVNAFELGTKGSFLDRSLTVDADVFYMHYNDLQETSYTQTLAAIVVNAAQSKSQGVELDGSWRASKYLVLRANLARLDAVYENFINGPCTSLQNLDRTCGTGQNMNGKTRPYSPKWSGDVGATLTVPFGGYELRVDPSVYFSTSYFETDAADPLLSQGGYALYDLRFGFAPQDSRWEVALLGKNLGNKEVFSFMLEMPGAPGTVEALPERSRYIGLQFTFHD
jgi:iron complex outermembrane recepter protein